jgi:predicted SAM-dependent methyltransferase
MDNIDKIQYPRTSFRIRKKIRAEIDNLLESLRKKSRKGLHLGAGNIKIPGLINCDLINPEADLKVDSTDLRQFDDESIDLIESHHSLEHLSFADTDKALSEWHRVLRPRGLLIITCPDILRICIKWIKYTMLYTLLPRPDKLDYIVKMLVGSQENEGMFHKNSFDARRLSRILRKHEFEVEFQFSPYPRRTTPSFIVIARKNPPGIRQ